MATYDDICATLQVADELFDQIQLDYTQCLKQQSVSATLSVRIKNFLENLRSPLDYLTKGICTDRLGLKESHKTYFPLAYENDAAFEKYVDRNLPGLKITNPVFYNTLRDLQAYQPNGCKALPRLSKLVNENKHNKLTPQTRQERRELKIDFPSGAGIQMGPGSSISGGGFITSGGGVSSPAGGTISGDSPATVTHNVQQTVTVWVSFRFVDTNEDVLDLLKHCRSDIERVVQTLKPIFWP